MSPLCLAGWGRDLHREPRAVLETLQRIYVQYPDIVIFSLQRKNEEKRGYFQPENAACDTKTDTVAACGVCVCVFVRVSKGECVALCDLRENSF